MSRLDAHPHNLLGRGVFDPGEEQRLLGSGAVFATRLTTGGGHTFTLYSTRPFHDHVRDVLTSVRRLQRQAELPTIQTPMPSV